MDLKLPLTKEDIMKILPHRSPFLFVDSVLELVPDKSIVGLKKFEGNEFFQGATPGSRSPVPTSILIEAVAQVGAILILSKEENAGKFIYFMGIDKIHIRRPIYAGEEIRIEAVVAKLRQRIGMLSGKAIINNEIVARGKMKYALRE